MTSKIIEVHTLLEIPNILEEITVYNVNSEHYIKDMICNFKFKSNKSLRNLLEKYKNYIINDIGPDHENVSLILEHQDFLNYLDMNWVQIQKIDSKLEINGLKKISPEELLNFCIEQLIITEKDIYNYILEDTGEYMYQIHKTFVKISSL